MVCCVLASEGCISLRKGRISLLWKYKLDILVSGYTTIWYLLCGAPSSRHAQSLDSKERSYEIKTQSGRKELSLITSYISRFTPVRCDTFLHIAWWYRGLLWRHFSKSAHEYFCKQWPHSVLLFKSCKGILCVFFDLSFRLDFAPFFVTNNINKKKKKPEYSPIAISVKMHRSTNQPSSEWPWTSLIIEEQAKKWVHEIIGQKSTIYMQEMATERSIVQTPAIPIRRKERAASLPFNDEDGPDVAAAAAAAAASAVAAVNAAGHRLVSLPVTRNNR